MILFLRIKTRWNNNNYSIMNETSRLYNKFEK